MNYENIKHMFMLIQSKRGEHKNNLYRIYNNLFFNFVRIRHKLNYWGFMADMTMARKLISLYKRINTGDDVINGKIENCSDLS